MNPATVAGTFDVEQILTVHLDGYEPIKGLRKESEWHGMVALRHDSGALLIARPETPGSWVETFSEILGSVFGRSVKKDTPPRLVVVMASPQLLTPISPTPTPTPATGENS